MAWANLPEISLKHRNVSRDEQASCLSPSGARGLLVPSARRIVQRWYRRDFELLGYPD